VSVLSGVSDSTKMRRYAAFLYHRRFDFPFCRHTQYGTSTLLISHSDNTWLATQLYIHQQERQKTSLSPSSQSTRVLLKIQILIRFYSIPPISVTADISTASFHSLKIPTCTSQSAQLLPSSRALHPTTVHSRQPMAYLRSIILSPDPPCRS
jgi:hypothetical protein